RRGVLHATPSALSGHPGRIESPARQNSRSQQSGRPSGRAVPSTSFLCASVTYGNVRAVLRLPSGYELLNSFAEGRWIWESSPRAAIFDNLANT
ncbi:MAG: hypothetical protein JXR97_06890, partial [Planctomycetes bacterium]|nr:hypothetical protein [Planctomycetota bacterium]